MAIYSFQTPDGVIHDLEAPEGTDPRQVMAVLEQRLSSESAFRPRPASKKLGGFWDTFFESVKTIPSLSDEAAAFAANPTEENRKAFIAAGDSKFRGVGFGEGENWAAFKQLLGGSLGQMAAPIAAATAGSFATPVAGVAAGVATSTAQYEIQNLLRQAQEQERAAAEGRAPQELELGKSLAASAAQAGLDVAQVGLFAKLLRAFPLARNLVLPEKEAAEQAVEKIVRNYQAGKLTYKNGVARGALEGFAFEVPQEMAQQALERWQAGLSLTDDEAQEEYKQAAIGAAILGPLMGGAAGTVGTARERATAEAKLEERGTEAGRRAAPPPPPETREGTTEEAPPVPPEPPVPRRPLGETDQMGLALEGGAAQPDLFAELGQPIPGMYRPAEEVLAEQGLEPKSREFKEAAKDLGLRLDRAGNLKPNQFIPEITSKVSPDQERFEFEYQQQLPLTLPPKFEGQGDLFAQEPIPSGSTVPFTRQEPVAETPAIEVPETQFALNLPGTPVERLAPQDRIRNLALEAIKTTPTIKAIVEATGLNQPKAAAIMRGFVDEGLVERKGNKFKLVEPAITEAPRGTAPEPVAEEAVVEPVGRGAELPVSRPAPEGRATAGFRGEGLGVPSEAAVRADERAAGVEPALTEPAGIKAQRASPKLDVSTRKFMLNKKGDRDALTQIADLMLQNAPSESKTLDYADSQLNPFGLSKETIKSKPGVNARRMATMLGPQLYGDPSDMGVVTIKEILQNSFDSIKGMIDNNELAKGKIDIDVDPDNRVIEMTDNGRGMTPELLGTKFLEIAGTGKDAKTPSGGFGIAKMLFLYGNKGIKVTTMRDGKVAEMITTGEQLFDALENPESAPDIFVRTPTEEDLQKFPDGHGTNIALTIPENFNDPKSGEVKKIDMVQYEGSVEPLIKSPLFADIDVTFRNKNWGVGRDTVPIGSGFPYNKYAEFTSVKFPWGKARVYVAPSDDAYGQNLHVLSNGLYQFSQKISKDPRDIWAKPVPFEFYVDIKPTVKPEDPGYPFTFNRKDFTEQAKKDYGKVMSYINALYAYQDISNSASSFGSLQYFDGSNTLSAPIEVKPTVPPAKTMFAGIQQGDNVTVEDGKLFVRGKELPELTPDQLREGIPKADQLKVDPSIIDPNRVMVHDNLKLVGTDLTFSDSMREAYGSDFNRFIYEIGAVFKDLRNDVVNVLGSDYSDLLQEGIGVSFDKEYRGVSIRVPFSGSFVNPFATRSVNTYEAAYGTFGTMIHELAHFKVRDHGADFPSEMQFIEYKLQAANKPKFDDYQKRLIDAFYHYQDVFEYGWRQINESGSYEARGDRFQDGSREDAGKPADEGVPRGKRRPSGAGRAGESVQPRNVSGVGPTRSRRPNRATQAAPLGTPPTPPGSPGGPPPGGPPTPPTPPGPPPRGPSGAAPTPPTPPTPPQRPSTPQQLKRDIKRALNTALQPLTSRPNYSQSFAKKVIDALGNVPLNLRKAQFAIYSMPQMQQLLSTVLPYISVLEKTNGLRAAQTSSGLDRIAKNQTRWQEIIKRHPRAKWEKLKEVATLGTLYQVDPTDSVVKDIHNKVRSGARTVASLTPVEKMQYEIAAMYYSLPSDLRSILISEDGKSGIVPEYRKYRQQKFDAMVKNWTKQGIPTTVIEKLRREFNDPQNNLSFYIPLRRDQGVYWLYYTDSNNNEVRKLFTNPVERSAFRQQIEAQGATQIIETSRYNDIKGEGRGKPPTGFLGEIVNLLETSLPSTMGQGKNDIISEVYDIFLDYMPQSTLRQELSSRQVLDLGAGLKLFGVYGFNKDFLETYAEEAPRIVYQLNNLRWVLPIEDVMKKLAEQRDRYVANHGIPSFMRGKLDMPPEQVNEAFDSIRKRIDFGYSPTYKPWVYAAATGNYILSIAANVSSGLINTTTIPMLTIPMLAAKYGVTPTLRAITRASAMFAKAPTEGGVTVLGKQIGDWSAAHGATGEYKQFFKTLIDRGVIGAVAEQELLQAQRIKLSGYDSLGDKVNYVAGYVMKNTERFNRETTLLASFMLAREKGKSFNAALEEAISNNNDVNGAVLPASDSRLYQTNLGRVLLTFRKYILNASILIAGTFKEALAKVEPNDAQQKLLRTIARRRLLGIYAGTYMVSGIGGMPLFGAAEVLAALMMNDDDEPYDLQQEVYESLGELGLNGPVNALIGLDVASRTGFTDVLWRDDPKRLAEAGYIVFGLEKLAGPTYSNVANWGRGFNLMAEGEIWRGTEAFMPAAIRNALKATRYAVEGARTKNGVPIEEDIGAWNITMQILGFAPADLATTQARVGAEYEISQKLRRRRTALYTQLYAAVSAGNGDAVREAYADIASFNRANPAIAIDFDGIQQSFTQRDRRNAESIDGLYLEENLRRATVPYVSSRD